MYLKAYGIIETLAPLHLGAAAGEESPDAKLQMGNHGHHRRSLIGI